MRLPGPLVLRTSYFVLRTSYFVLALRRIVLLQQLRRLRLGDPVQQALRLVLVAERLGEGDRRADGEEEAHRHVALHPHVHGEVEQARDRGSERNTKGGADEEEPRGGVALREN